MPETLEKTLYQDALFGTSKEIRKPKTKRTDYSMPTARAIVPLTEFAAELISEYKQPWINHTAPWNKNNDDSFLTKIDFMPEIANAMDLRTNLILTSRHRPEWKESKQYKISESNQEGATELIDYMLDEIDMQWLLTLYQRPVYTGKEGILHDFEDVDGIFCPTEIHHIDHRRFKANSVRGTIALAVGIE